VTPATASDEDIPRIEGDCTMTSLKDILSSNHFTFDENGKIKIPSHFKKIKLDIGVAIEAIHTEYWLNHEPNDLIVFGFEPLPSSVEETIKYYKQPTSKWTHVAPSNKIDLNWLNNNFLIAPVALGNVDVSGSFLDFYVTTSKNVGCSSLFKPNTEVFKQIGVGIDHIMKVPVFKLSDFFDLIPFDQIEYIDYIKVDVQGNDLNIIKSGGQYIQDRVVYVTMEPEVGQYIGADDNSTSNMIAYMDTIGFDFIHHPNACDPTFLNRKFKHLANSIYIKQFN